MKCCYTSLILIFFISIAGFSANAQATLRGDVTDAGNSDPLIGASVVIKGTTEGTVTEYDGTFELKTKQPLPLTLIISYVGYNEIELPVNAANQPLK
ncbi:MAG: carboxypeptidase-like regulatory domain-containing protein, partial [Saprospiraceae bacterium]|nr:carboxypeptidase-like regulatory domain-containing protein [Saprospiraceae bacterium]